MLWSQAAWTQEGLLLPSSRTPGAPRLFWDPLAWASLLLLAEDGWERRPGCPLSSRIWP